MAPEGADASTINIMARYQNVCEAVPHDILSKEALPFFVDGLKMRVVLVEITAYNEETAYTTLETLNGTHGKRWHT